MRTFDSDCTRILHGNSSGYALGLLCSLQRGGRDDQLEIGSRRESFLREAEQDVCVDRTCGMFQLRTASARVMPARSYARGLHQA